MLCVIASLAVDVCFWCCAKLPRPQQARSAADAAEVLIKHVKDPMLAAAVCRLLDGEGTDGEYNGRGSPGPNMAALLESMAKVRSN